MPLNFPDNPSVNQEFTNGFTIWVWNGATWNLKAEATGGGGGGGGVGPTGPTGPTGPAGAGGGGGGMTPWFAATYVRSPGVSVSPSRHIQWNESGYGTVEYQNASATLTDGTTLSLSNGTYIVTLQANINNLVGPSAGISVYGRDSGSMLNGAWYAFGVPDAAADSSVLFTINSTHVIKNVSGSVSSLDFYVGTAGDGLALHYVSCFVQKIA